MYHSSMSSRLTPVFVTCLMVICMIAFVKFIDPRPAVYSQAEPTPTPTGGDTYITNTYYGIECGDVTTPCHVIIDNLPDAAVPITIALPLAITLPLPINITATVPITTVSLPRPWGNEDGNLLAALWAVIILHLLILTFIDLFERNMLLLIYRFLFTTLFMVIEVWVIYPWTRQGLTLGVYGAWLAFWIFLMMVEQILRWLRGLTNK